MRPQNRLVGFKNLSFGLWTCFFLGGRWGMMATLLPKRPEQYLQKTRSSVFTVLS